MNLLEPILQSEHLKTLCDAVGRPDGRAAVFGVQGVHRALYAAALSINSGNKVLVVTQTDAEAVTMAADLAGLGVAGAAFPSRDFVLMDVEGMSHETELQRLGVMGGLTDGTLDVVCCSVESFCQYTMPREVYTSLSVKIRRGGTLDVRKFCETLVAAGYARGDRVEGPGQFSLRGGILDVYAAHSDAPCRIELFGNEIDAISTFDAESQRRTGSIKSAVITPAREVVPGAAAAALLRAFAGRCENKAGALAELALRDAERIESGVAPGSADRYLHAVYDHPETIADYLPGAVFFFCEPAALEKRHKSLIFSHTEDLLSLERQGLYLKNSGAFYRDELEISGHPAVYADAFARTLEGRRLDALITLRAGIIPRWNGEVALLVEDVRSYTDTGYACVVLAATTRAAAALASDLSAAGLTAAVMGAALPAPGAVGVAVGALSTGFELPALHLCVITGRSGQKPQAHRLRAKKRGGRAISSLEDLRPGDYVVHQSHGIGVYDGIHRIDHHGLVRDYIKIKYQGADTLYVPVTQLDMVSQYISPKGDDNVRLAKLHSGEWQKTKQNVYRAVREMARELIALYARREASEGVAFSADTDWQRGFEARFAYEETADQLRAVAEIKKDMERPRPMDRLLCGDVGVGKTEVALRAVFKAVSDGYQCAVLVPTTILAWQHANTFRERMEAYPIKIAMLSRFSTTKEIREAVAGIRSGAVDIAIGTHRLLQKDIEFKKLGLLVVDEEQRFGVGHKEKLKERFSGVDVLTLSATPIPRTLNMAMSGIRDMSTIEEPPLDRHPVQTYVMEYEEDVLLDAVKRELSRGGQVYYLHNRVETIERTAYRLSQQLPDATVEVAHGQMDEGVLSEVWRRLIAGEIDVLVCTTIIETGVDVPNCNTLVVEDADRMGLSQLYQLRGRVGRSGRRAYAYFTFRRDRIVSEVAQKRLAAIRDFTSFGSGFKIAMRDLQIRGAGGVLSARQSGHMAAVGYDTYLKILEQAVGDESGIRPARGRAVECTVDLAVSAYIPESYIPDDESRIEMYKRIAGIADAADAEDVLDELHDRFGAPPAAVRTLVDVSLIRIQAGEQGYTEVQSQKDGANLLFYTDAPDTAERLRGYMKKRERRVLIAAKGRAHVAVEIREGETPTDAAVSFLAATGTAATRGE